MCIFYTFVLKKHFTMESILDKLVDLVPLWILIVFVLMFYAFKFYYSRFKVMEEKTTNANCARNHEAIAALQQDMKEVKTDIEQIKIILANKFPKALDIFGRKNSPRKLNEMGEKIFAEIDGRKFLEENKSLFFAEIDKNSPKTALDVETYAFLACHVLTANEIFNKIKGFVYNCPEIEVEDRNGEKVMYEITMGDICFILGIPLRDMYLEEHKDITL